MSSSVKVTDETKSRLEELQAEIRLKTGESVTQQALLERVVADSYESRAELIESFREYTPPSEETIEQWLAGTTQSGTETDEDAIDDVLYG